MLNLKFQTGRGIIVIGLLTVVCLCMDSCHAVQPYQRAYLNDREMRFGISGANGAEDSFQTYREGASGGDSHSVSGGCGCN